MKKFLSVLILGGFVSLVACNKNDSASTAGNASINIHLVDGPAAYDKVYIDIQDVQVKAEDDVTETGWKSLNVPRKGIYNLLLAPRSLGRFNHN